MNILKKSLAFCLALAACSVGYAHDGHSASISFFSGFFHPLTGIDHLLVALSVGLIAANLLRSNRSGRLALLPLIAFLSSALLGSALGVQGVGLALTMEWLIVSSLVFFGAVLAWNRGTVIGHQDKNNMLALIMAACALFGFAHGYVHTAELATDAALTASAPYALLEFELGWLISTALIHVSGFAVSIKFFRKHLIVQRVAGTAIALTGVALSAALMGVTAI